MAEPSQRTERDYYPYTSRKKPVTSAPVAAAAEDEDDDEQEVSGLAEKENDAEDEEEDDEYDGGAVQAKSRKVRDGLKPDAYEDRPAFGIPRLVLTKEEFITIRRGGLWTTDVFNKVGMDAKKSVMITNKEAAALTTLRVTRGITWKYEPTNKHKQKWLEVTDQRCKDYERKMDDKIIKNLTKAIADKEAENKRSGDEDLGGEERATRRVRRE